MGQASFEGVSVHTLRHNKWSSVMVVPKHPYHVQIFIRNKFYYIHILIN